MEARQQSTTIYHNLVGAGTEMNVDDAGLPLRIYPFQLEGTPMKPGQYVILSYYIIWFVTLYRSLYIYSSLSIYLSIYLSISHQLQFPTPDYTHPFAHP